MSWKKCRLQNVFLMITGILVVTISHSVISEGQQRQRGGAGFSPDVVDGEMIVKYKDTVTACVHCLLKNRKSFNGATADRGNLLDELHAKFEIGSARPVFRTEEEEGRVFGVAGEVPVVSLRQYHANRAELATARFPGRAVRVPQGSTLPDIHHIYVLALPGYLNIAAVAAEFRRDPHIEYAHPNYWIQVDEFKPNDPFYRSSGSWGQSYDDLWALKKDKINVKSAWAVTRGKGIIVAVVDTGLDYNHKDIAQNVWKNTGETAGNGLDDDGNGFVDDIRGWDFVTCEPITNDEVDCNRSKPEDNDPLDDNFHGTHVAGTIAAIGDNRFGIIGVAPKATILPVRAFNRGGRGKLEWISSGLSYAAHNGADVINNSWSCNRCGFVPLLEDAVRVAHRLGSVVVFAAGNTGGVVEANSPQNMRDPKPIVVAASTEEDRPAFFTSIGAGVDLSAPGGGSNERDPSNILSLKADGCTRCNRKRLVGNHFLRAAGTSMAAPHASGVATLILAMHPRMSHEEVRQVMRATADDIEAPGFDPFSGAGRLNAFRALTVGEPLDVTIQKPQNLSISGPGTTFRIRGTADGKGFQEYQLFYSMENPFQWVSIHPPVTGPVRNGILGTFTTRALPLGWKFLKLSATDASGLKFEDVVRIGTQLKAKRVRASKDHNSSHVDVSDDLIIWGRTLHDSSSEIWVFDVTAKTARKIADVAGNTPVVRISGNVAAWAIQRSTPKPAAAGEMYYCVLNRQTGVCRPKKLTDSGVGSTPPAVSSNRVAWVDFTDRKWRLFLLDVRTKKKRQISVDADNAMDLSPDFLVYNTFHSGVRLLDLNTNADRQIFPGAEALKISQRQVAYSLRPSRIRFSRNLDIYLYDIDTGESRLVVEDPKNFGDFDFSEGRIVWTHDDRDIHLFDLRKNQREAIALTVASPVDSRYLPAISGRVAAWLHEIAPFVAEINYAEVPEN